MTFQKKKSIYTGPVSRKYVKSPVCLLPLEPIIAMLSSNMGLYLMQLRFTILPLVPLLSWVQIFSSAPCPLTGRQNKGCDTTTNTARINY